MNYSLWSDTVTLPTFKTLQRDMKTDVLIIGGGICGLLCAYFLQNAGISYILVEGSTICSGTTQNTTAKITSQHGLIYNQLIRKSGPQKAKQYFESNEYALQMYRKLAKNIDCDFSTQNSYVYSQSDSYRILDEVAAVNALGFPAEFVPRPDLPFETNGAIRFPNQAQFHPLKFLCAIAKDLNIYEHTYIQKVDHHTALFQSGKITANKIIVTTHYPFINKHGSYFLKLYQHRSYVLALENAPLVNGMYVDESSYGLSFRNYKNYLLLGGGSHRTGKQGGNWSELRDFARIHFPQAKEKHCWATQDCMSLDSVPYIGHYSLNTPYLYVASGFHKWGMTSSMVAAIILRDMICGKDNKWADVYSPHRSMVKPQLFINASESTCNLLTPSVKRCSHMGCTLKWNKAERTWDCPCHGSRFDLGGDLIDNPAKRGIKN